MIYTIYREILLKLPVYQDTCKCISSCIHQTVTQVKIFANKHPYFD